MNKLVSEFPYSAKIKSVEVELIYDYRALVNSGEYGEKEYKKEVETGRELYATSKVVQFYKSQSPTLEE